MARQRMKVRDKKVSRMTRDGLVETNLTDHSTVRVSSRTADVKMEHKSRPSGRDLQMKGAPAKDSKVHSRDAPDSRNVSEKKRSYQKRQVRRGTAGSERIGKNGQRAGQRNNPNTDRSKLQEPKNSSRLRQKKIELASTRGDSNKKKTGGSKKPQGKRRLKFAYEETAEAVMTETDSAALNQMESDGVNFRKDRQKAKQKKQAYRQEEKKQELKTHSAKKKVYQETEGPVKKNRLHFDGEGAPAAMIKGIGKVAGTATVAQVHRKISESEDENAAVEAAHKLEESGEGAARLKHGISKRKQRKQEKQSLRMERQSEEKVGRIFFTRKQTEEKIRNQSALKKMIQKQRIKREYTKAAHTAQMAGAAPVGTIDYIKKIGGKVTNFFVENRKVYLSVLALIGLMMLIMSGLTSCSAMFLENLVDYTGVSYISSDEAIREADLYYTKKEAQLQEKINQMRTQNTGYDNYRFNIAPIEHDPFILISYLSAKYEEFTFDEVKDELDTLFDLQYNLQTEAVTESVTETVMVTVGESLGQVVTSGYCSCPICCGIWSGGPTASGVMPTANHTIAVDASNPFVPMGTKVVMNGVEYTVEDTGGFARYGVQFDVYYDSHSAALNHGHRTWEAYLADDNGDHEVEVTRTTDQNVFNVTLTSKSLQEICERRLGFFDKELFNAYNEVKGNLQMFKTPVVYNWYGVVSSNYGYRVHPITGANQLHNGMDLALPEGTEVFSGLTGTVSASSYNDSYGNYVIVKNIKGYEIRYAHLQSRNVSTGDTIRKGDTIGKVGNTGSSTGSHLHIELLHNEERLNPIFYFETGEEEPPAMAGSAYATGSARALLEEADRYLGTPYVWGGYSPSGFDCSGFVSYCLTNSGARNTGRLTAQGLYNICTRVTDPQPGDLIFFTGTYDAGEPVTHVGIYVGNGQMIHCGHPVQYASIYSSYWQSHFYAFGRW